jgi:phage FluMu protein Com
MPIRFRCPFCGQLMGISRRKAGQVVICPRCQGQVEVPGGDEASPAPASPPVPAQGPAPAPLPMPASLELRPVGVEISPRQAVRLTVAGVLLLLLAFAVGLLVGRFLL